MFGFKLWARFGAFRDPLTITQNLTLPIPPKTTIGGILAAILGIDYNTYFSDDDFFNFRYSIVVQRPIRKKSFAQNYIEDYTGKSQKKLNDLKKYLSSNEIDDKVVSDLLKTFPKPKPIYRELLIEPEYLVIVHSFKYEDKIVHDLKNHCSSYQLYLGNTEFAGNYKYLFIQFEKATLSKLDSFSANPANIFFEPDKKYTPVYAATTVKENRSYRDYKHIVLCDKEITLKTVTEGYIVKTEGGTYRCEFV